MKDPTSTRPFAYVFLICFPLRKYIHRDKRQEGGVVGGDVGDCYTNFPKERYLGSVVNKFLRRSSLWLKKRVGGSPNEFCLRLK